MIYRYEIRRRSRTDPLPVIVGVAATLRVAEQLAQRARYPSVPYEVVVWDTLKRRVVMTFPEHAQVERLE